MDASSSTDVYQCHIVQPEQQRIHISMPPITTASKSTQKDDTTCITTPSSQKTDEIPETVLQYERQMRKRRASSKAEGPVTFADLHTIYKDDFIVVTNKPSGILCVPGVHNNPSLLSLVYKEFGSTSMKPDSMIVHRLDMDTSGLVVFALTVDMTKELHKSFRECRVEKQYEALVCGHVWAHSGMIDLPLQRDHKQPPFMRVSTPTSEQEAAKVVHDLQHNGWKKIMMKKPKPSQTEFRVLERTVYRDTQLPVTRLLLTPITGRTHQLRVHCAATGHPIVADPAYGVYGEASANGGFSETTMNVVSPHRASLDLQKQINALVQNNRDNMCLHAKTLSLPHPASGETMSWEAPSPF